MSVDGSWIVSREYGFSVLYSFTTSVTRILMNCLTCFYQLSKILPPPSYVFPVNGRWWMCLVLHLSSIIRIGFLSRCSA